MKNHSILYPLHCVRTLSNIPAFRCFQYLLCSVILLSIACNKRVKENQEKGTQNESQGKEDSAKNYQELSDMETIKGNVFWEGTESDEVLYFVGWRSNNRAAFITSQESYECGGVNSDLLVQNLVNDNVISKKEVGDACESTDWTNNEEYIVKILDRYSIEIDHNANIALGDGNQLRDIVTNHKEEIYTIDIERSKEGDNYTAKATAPNGKRKTIGKGSEDFMRYDYIGYVQSPDRSRIAIVLRAYSNFDNLSEPIIIGCSLEEDTF